jgi:adenylate cyclase
MAKEIERKFLVKDTVWNSMEKPDGKYYRQGYLLNDSDKVLRIRIAGDQGFLTIKGAAQGITRTEFEYAVPKQDVEEMMEQFKPEGTEKLRYKLPAGNGLTWEIDEFLGENKGLLVAEIELLQEDQLFDRPEWLGEEVTFDEKYFNASLALRPFSSW